MTDLLEVSPLGDRHPWESRLDFDALAPDFAAALAALDRAAVHTADQAGLPAALRELVRLRASQLNGCAYCVDMHAKDARRAGVSAERLDGLAVWREMPCYSDAERAALALAEAVTLCADTHVPAEVWDAAAARLSPTGLAAVLALTVAINAWNRVGVATRAWLPGSYAA
jgi:AhpD family alkylhydroperoxidase